MDQQFGFQKHRSSEMALLNIKEMILNNFENKEYTIGLFLDFRKVFDSIRHDILFDKLPFYGMRGVALNFLRSYLSKRLQFTSLNGYRSSTKGISCGVPQGSILGPLLFILYINDIVHIPSTPVITHYADDTSVFFWSVSAQVNNWLIELSMWVTLHKLELNVRKTKYVIFKPRNKLDDYDP